MLRVAFYNLGLYLFYSYVFAFSLKISNFAADKV